MCYNDVSEVKMENQSKYEDFFNSVDELINCKFLVAEYKLQKMLQQLAAAEDVCSLIGECLDQFNRDREFAKAFVQDGQGDFMFVPPEEEYKMLALVFCTLVDIDAKNIEFTDFVKRFFGKDTDNPFKNFVDSMIVPFRNLLAEAFGGEKRENTNTEIFAQEELEENDQVQQFNLKEENTYQETQGEDKFVRAQKIAVQILSQLEYARNEFANEMAKKICRAIVRTTDIKDLEVTQSLVFALKSCKAKQVKFLVKEIEDLFLK